MTKPSQKLNKKPVKKPSPKKSLDGFVVRDNSLGPADKPIILNSAEEPIALGKIEEHKSLTVPDLDETMQEIKTVKKIKLIDVEEPATESDKKKQPKKEEKKKEKKAPSKLSKIQLTFAFLLSALELITGGILFYHIASTNILDLKFLAIIFAVLALLFLFTTWKLFRKKTHKIPRILFGLLTVILSTVYIIGSIYLSDTISFLRNITNRSKTETQTYSVLVLKSENLESINNLENKKIGFQTTNPNLALATEKLKETINYQETLYTDLGSMMLDLTNQKIPAITVSNTYLDILKEDHSDFYETTTELFTYEITYEVTTNASEVNVATEPFILYLSGRDGDGELSDYGRSDVNMLIVVNPRTNKLLMVSIPRDYYVQLHGTTGLKDKLTHAGLYGSDMIRATIEDLFGVKIDHMVTVGFSAVRNVVDTLGGITVNSDTAFRARHYNCYFNKGLNNIDGTCALAYARERYAYYGSDAYATGLVGDKHRIKNQQDVLSGIIDKVLEPQNIIHYNDILFSIQDSLITTLTYDDITNFAKQQLNSMQGWDIETYSVDGTDYLKPTYSYGEGTPLFVFEPDQTTVDTAIEKINSVLNER